MPAAAARVYRATSRRNTSLRGQPSLVRGPMMWVLLPVLAAVTSADTTFVSPSPDAASFVVEVRVCARGVRAQCEATVRSGGAHWRQDLLRAADQLRLAGNADEAIAVCACMRCSMRASRVH